MDKQEFSKEKLIQYWLASSDDDYKMSFQKMCTPEFTAQWIERLKQKRLWIKKLIKE